LDYRSVIDNLGKIEEYSNWGYEDGNPYRDYYLDLLNEMANISADMYNELQGFTRWDTGSTDFDDVCALYSEIDMWELLENEGIWNRDNIEKEKQVRRNRLLRLKKEDLLNQTVTVFGFLTRYMELLWAFTTIKGVIEELEFHHSALRSKDGVTDLGDAAWT